MLDLKNVIAFIAVVLTFAGYIPYLRDLLKGKTVPHLYSWFLWCLVTTLVFALQLVGGAGIGAFVTLAAALMCIVVIFLGFRQEAKIKITLSDTLFLVLALVALGFWLVAKQPVISAILATLIDLLAFVPTIRKSWSLPHSETVSFYALNTFRFGLAFFSLHQYSLQTALYPATWLVANGLFAVMLVVRRQVVEN